MRFQLPQRVVTQREESQLFIPGKCFGVESSKPVVRQIHLRKINTSINNRGSGQVNLYQISYFPSPTRLIDIYISNHVAFMGRHKKKGELVGDYRKEKEYSFLQHPLFLIRNGYSPYKMSKSTLANGTVFRKATGRRGFRVYYDSLH